MMRTPHPILFGFGLGLGAAACGPPDRILPVFENPVVEAPARQMRLAAFVNGDCSEILSVPDSELNSVSGDRYFDRVVPYPPRDEAEPLAGAPVFRPFVLAASALDRDGLVIGRGCQVVELTEESDTVELAMYPRPPCATPPSETEMALVVEVSDAMFLADIAVEETLRTVINTFFLVEDPNARYLLVLASDREIRTLGPTSDIQALRSEISSLQLSGPSVLHDGMVQGSRILRDRASCRAEPGLMVLAASPDQESEAIRDEVILSIRGEPDDPDDDVVSVGVGVQPPGLDALRQVLFPPAEVFGASTAQAFRVAVQQGRETLGTPEP